MELRLTVLERDLGKRRAAHAAELARVNLAADDLDNLKTALGAATRSYRQQAAVCVKLRQAPADRILASGAFLHCPVVSPGVYAALHYRKYSAGLARADSLSLSL